MRAHAQVEAQGTNVVITHGTRKLVVPYTAHNKPEAVGGAAQRAAPAPWCVYKHARTRGAREPRGGATRRLRLVSRSTLWHTLLQIPYEGMKIDLVMECTGEFLTRAALQPYFNKGIKKVGACRGVCAKQARECKCAYVV